MRALDPAVVAALEADALAPRDFLWIVARDRETGDPVADGFWSDLGAVNASVIDPADGVTRVRTYHGAGDLISVAAVPLVTGLTVQTIPIRLSQISPRVAQIVRGYDLKQARVEVHRGFLDPSSLRLVAPAVPRFVGFVDEVVISTPAEGEQGEIALTVASHVQELTRFNTATRSDADQQQRYPGDGFFRHAAAIANWQIWWQEG